MRKHFLESLEREIDYNREYRKLEEMVINERVYYYNPYVRESINMWIERHFRYWEKRNSFTSFSELREHLGFPVRKEVQNSWVMDADVIDINGYFLYGEMLLNIVDDLKAYLYSDIAGGIDHVINTLRSNVERAGFEIKKIDNEIMIVEKNSVAFEVADIVPDLSDVIIEYNHYLLKGDLGRKQEILKKLADALEPKRQELIVINKNMSNDFFFMVNKMNVRHNNCDPSDTGKYCKQFAQLEPKEKEAWYDTIYEQGLALFVLLEQQERNKKISVFKASLGN